MAFDPVLTSGVWFVTVDEPWLCSRCAHAKHWPSGGMTCLADPLRIALTRTCRQRSRHPFNLWDALMDPATGKASLNALILAVFALLSIWVVVDRENLAKDDVPSLLAMVLGIFVAGRVGAQAITAFKPPEAGSTMKETVRETIVTAKDS